MSRFKIAFFFLVSFALISLYQNCARDVDSSVLDSLNKKESPCATTDGQIVAHGQTVNLYSLKKTETCSQSCDDLVVLKTCDDGILLSDNAVDMNSENHSTCSLSLCETYTGGGLTFTFTGGNTARPLGDMAGSSENRDAFCKRGHGAEAVGTSNSTMINTYFSGSMVALSNTDKVRDAKCEILTEYICIGYTVRLSDQSSKRDFYGSIECMY